MSPGAHMRFLRREGVRVVEAAARNIERYLRRGKMYRLSAGAPKGGRACWLIGSLPLPSNTGNGEKVLRTSYQPIRPATPGRKR